MLRLDLPPRGAIAPNSDFDPLKYYYAPIVGRVFVARINLGLALLEGRAARLLEVGYGSGLLLPTLSTVCDQLDGVDLASDPDEVRATARRLGVTNLGDLVRGSVCQLPFADGRHDAVVAFSILEHLRAPELGEAMAEVARVLRPGGRFLVGCPAVHKGMNLAFSAIGFRGIEDHHFSAITDVLDAGRGAFSVEKRATWPRVLPLGWAPYNAVLLRRS